MNLTLLTTNEEDILRFYVYKFARKIGTKNKEDVLEYLSFYIRYDKRVINDLLRTMRVEGDLFEPQTSS